MESFRSRYLMSTVNRWGEKKTISLLQNSSTAISRSFFSANLRYKRVPVVRRVGNTILWINHYVPRWNLIDWEVCNSWVQSTFYFTTSLIALMIQWMMGLLDCIIHPLNNWSPNYQSACIMRLRDISCTLSKLGFNNFQIFRFTSSVKANYFHCVARP